MKSRINKLVVDDMFETGSNAVITSLCALSYCGIEYIGQTHFGFTPSEVVLNTVPLLSPEGNLYVAQGAAVIGTIGYGLSTVYNALKMPVQAVQGKYKRPQVGASKLGPNLEDNFEEVFA